MLLIGVRAERYRHGDYDADDDTVDIITFDFFCSMKFRSWLRKRLENRRDGRKSVHIVQIDQSDRSSWSLPTDMTCCAGSAQSRSNPGNMR